MNFIHQHIENGIMSIELNRPEVLNAIHLGMVEELIIAFAEAEINPRVRVIIVRGAGEKSFSSGGDLLEFHAITTKEAAEDMMHRVSELLHRISSSTKLTIAAINGYALGGGAELITAFDIRIATDDAKIGFVQSKLGITTSWGGGSRLITLIGRANALPLLISGEVLSASEWSRLGFVHKIFPKNTFHKDCSQYARQLAERSLDVIRAYKKLCMHGEELHILMQSVEEEIERAANLWIGEEHIQAANRFFETKQGS